MFAHCKHQVQAECGQRPLVSDVSLIADELLNDMIPEIVSPTSMVCSQLVFWSTGSRREPEAARTILGRLSWACNLNLVCSACRSSLRASRLLRDWLQPVCACDSLTVVRMAHVPWRVRLAGPILSKLSTAEVSVDVMHGRVQLHAQEHLQWVQWWSEFTGFWEEQKQAESALPRDDCLMTLDAPSLQYIVLRCCCSWCVISTA